MSDSKKNQYIKLDNEKIKRKAPGFVNTKMIGLYAMISTYLSNPEFKYCAGGLKTALMKHCTNRKLSFGNTWKMLMDTGYLKRCRIPYENNKFRDFYELLPLPNLEIPAVRNLTSAEGKTYLKNKSDFEIPKHNYTGISVEMLNDERLSLLSKGLYCIIQRLILIAANKPDLIITKDLLSSNLSEGFTAFNNAWKQLKALGYLELTRIYDDSLCQFRYLYKLNCSPYDRVGEKPKIKDDRAGERQRKLHKPKNFSEKITPVQQAPIILTGEEQHYYTEEERLAYNEGAGFETWLPPAYTTDNLIKLREQIKYQIQYDWQISTRHHSPEIVESVVNILVDTALLKDRGQAYSKMNDIPVSLLKVRLHNLDCESADYAISTFENIISKKRISNKYNYLLKILFNADTNLELDMTAEYAY